jgi:hypothetical protein
MTRKPFPGLVGAAMLMIAAEALAQNAPGRVLKATNLRAFTPSIFTGECLTVGFSFVHLLTPTVITCPGSSTCTLHIEVSSQGGPLVTGASADFRVEVDDVAASPGGGLIRVARNNDVAPTGHDETFQFLKTGVTPGNHIVEWLARVNGGTSMFCNRIQKINIYIP